MSNIAAFPRPIGFSPTSGATHSTAQSGMSLRDYFAAKAMQVFAANDYLDYEKVAEMAYKQADAMIAQRNLKTS